MYDSDGFPFNNYILVNAANTSKHSLDLDVTLETAFGNQIPTLALLDSGAYSNFINHAFVKKHNLTVTASKKRATSQIEVKGNLLVKDKYQGF